VCWLLLLLLLLLPMLRLGTPRASGGLLLSLLAVLLLLLLLRPAQGCPLLLMRLPVAEPCPWVQLVSGLHHLLLYQQRLLLLPISTPSLPIIVSIHHAVHAVWLLLLVGCGRLWVGSSALLVVPCRALLSVVHAGQHELTTEATSCYQAFMNAQGADLCDTDTGIHSV
jgi:hypothetical protein